MDVGDITIRFKTCISDIYFDDEEDSNNFDEWLNDQLSRNGLFKYSLVLNPVGIPGVEKLEVVVDEFDYNHYLDVRVIVDDNSHTFDEVYDNQELLDYVEREVAPMLVTEFNNVANEISFPMSDSGTSFSYMKFASGEFYSMLGYTEKYGYYPYKDVRSVPFTVEDDYEVYV